MRCHFSIRVTNPRHVAEVLVEVGNGTIINVGLYPNCFIASLGDAHGTVIEVFPLETEVFAKDRQGQATSEHNPVSCSSSAAYGPLLSERSADEVYAVAQREASVQLNRRAAPLM